MRKARATYDVESCQADLKTMNNTPFTDANTLASEYGAYFAALTTACGALVDATVGGYYASLVSAVQTAFNSQRSSENTLITSAISKENSFNTPVLGLSTTYATAEINADYDYYHSLINSHAAELQTALANEQSLIAAEIACYRAFSDAAFTRDSNVVTANADAARRQLIFTEAYGNQLWGTLWGGLPGLDLSSNLTVRTVSSNPLGVDSAALLNLVPISYVTPEDPEDEAPNYWSTFNPMNATVLAMATKSAQLDYDAATEAAYATFMTASMTAYSAGVSDELDAARAEVVAELGARSTFNTSIMNALDTANTSYRTAVGASDLSAAIESYQNAYYDTDATLNSSVASAFGTFQIGVRQDRLAGVTSSNPRYSAYASDVTWATQTKSLRDQTLTQYNEDQSEYVEAVAAAQKSYNVNALSSLLDAADQAFTVNKTHALQTASTRAALELADYDAEDARARAYLTAYVNEALANAAFASARAQNRATAYAQKLGEVENAVDAAKLHGDGRSVVLKSVNESESGAGVSLDGLEKLKRQIDRVYATASAADAALASADEAAIAADKAANQATREAAIDLADETASAAKRAARDDAFAALLGAAATAKGAYKGIVDDLDEALATQIAAYNTTIRSANATFSDDLKELDKVYSYYQGEIDLFGGSVPANAYPSDPQFDYEICFVAGTPVLMADGSRRPIESLRPGDVVLAAAHLAPESTPAPAKVVRFFDNGEKTVVRLIVGAQELVCTPEHPFYVLGKGWVRADALVEGELCLNAAGERVAFVSREAIAETRRVYNIEVEGAHTYFVGDDDGVLAHNDCGLSIFWDEYRSSLGAFFRGAGHTVAESAKYTIDVLGVSADGLVTYAGALTGNNWSLNYHELSDTGRYYSSLNPAFDNQVFLSAVADNSVQTGIASFTLGSSEIYSGLQDYFQTGDADALAERMGGMATGNLVLATGIRYSSYNYRLRNIKSKIKLNQKYSDSMKGERVEKPKNVTVGSHENIRSLVRDVKFLKKDGTINWPTEEFTDHGAIKGTERDIILRQGVRVDRYNVPNEPPGYFVSPYDLQNPIPYEARSLPYIKEKVEYRVYEVVKPIPAHEGIIEPWFDQPGRGIQYRLDQKVDFLLDNGFLKDITPGGVSK
ncbi:MAG: glycohydrolase toxin TNT-related protein [Thermoguttaceae bacterium]|nr:glycohydrolase toxin TNT-related protein [Thermoguttaceae bacterium]